MLHFSAYDSDQEGTSLVALTPDTAVVGDRFGERLRGRLPEQLGAAESETSDWLFWPVVSMEPV